MAGKYSFSARKAGKSCDFVATADAREEVLKQAKAHAATCSACAGMTEQQVDAAVVASEPAAPTAQA